MPRIPRPGGGEQDAPPEQPTEQLTSGGPLATPAPQTSDDAEATAAPAFTTGDPLGGSAPATEQPPEPQADEPLWTSPGESEAPTQVTPPGAAPDVTPEAPEGAAAAPTEEDASAPAQPAEAPATTPAEGVTVEEAAPADATPRFRERTKMRRRMRELRRLREIAFRDLGGLTFDLHRFGRERQDLVAEKLRSLEQIDGELRVLEGALDERRTIVELREPGIAACSHCGTLHGSDANFCPACGTPVRGAAPAAEATPEAAPAAESAEPTPPAETPPS